MDRYGSPPIWQVYEPIEAELGTEQADMVADTMESLAVEEAKRIEAISHSCGPLATAILEGTEW